MELPVGYRAIQAALLTFDVFVVPS
jgi:hypothetical protein